MRVRISTSSRVSLLTLGLIAVAGISMFGQSQPYPLIPSTRADFAPKDPIKARTAAEQEKMIVFQFAEQFLRRVVPALQRADKLPHILVGDHIRRGRAESAE